MGFRFSDPLALALLAIPAASVWVWRAGAPPLGRRQALAALWIRVTILVLLVFAVAGFEATRFAANRAVIVVADRSASVQTSWDAEAGMVADIAKHLGRNDLLGVITAGREALVDSPPGPPGGSSAPATRPNPDYTNLEAGLRLAQSLMPGGFAHQVVMLTDGRQNIGDAEAEARYLRKQQTRVDAVQLPAPQGPEALVEAVQVPSVVPGGARSTATISVVSNTPGPARLRVWLDKAEVASMTLDLDAGTTSAEVQLPSAGAGLHAVRADLEPAQDTYPQNNTGQALLRVLGKQKVLVVEGSPGEGANLVSALAAASIGADVVQPAGAPASVAGLFPYQAVALADVDADALGTQAMRTIQSSVRDLGLGLAVFGGPTSFGPGGYEGTALEQALPVSMDISKKKRRAPIAVMLVLESMESPEADAVMRGAANSVVENLSEQDMVGVTDSLKGVVVPLTKLTKRKAVTEAIAQIPSFGDPGSYSPYLEAARSALAGHPEASRHIILVGDGDASGAYADQAASLAASGIVVSSVGINVHHIQAAMDLMRSVSTAGKGHFYQSDDPSQVPDLLLQETNKSLRPWITEKHFRAISSGPSQALAGLDPAALPALDGYVATTAKPAAETLLSTPEHDPLLAQWRYGAGRSAAWTSDISGRWTRDLVSSEASGRLFANIVASTLPLEPDPGMQLAATQAGDRGHLVATIPGGLGGPGDTAAVATVLSPDLTSLQVPMQPAGPGRVQAGFPASKAGTYLFTVSISQHGAVTRTGTAGMASSYSPEFRYLGTDPAGLKAIVEAGGGSIAADPAALLRHRLPRVPARTPVAPWLLAAAVLLIPVDIAARRLVFRRADLGDWAGLVRRREVEPVPAEATIGRLKDRIGHHRERGVQPPPPEGEQEDLAARLLARKKANPPSG